VRNPRKTKIFNNNNNNNNKNNNYGDNQQHPFSLFLRSPSRNESDGSLGDVIRTPSPFRVPNRLTEATSRIYVCIYTVWYIVYDRVQVVYAGRALTRQPDNRPKPFSLSVRVLSVCPCGLIERDEERDDLQTVWLKATHVHMSGFRHPTKRNTVYKRNLKTPVMTRTMASSMPVETTGQAEGVSGALDWFDQLP
jgi:hypothetical protein